MIATVEITLWAKEACQLADETDVKERMMKATHEGRAGRDLSQPIQNDKGAGQTGHDKRTEVGPTVESAKVNICKGARELRRITDLLNRKGDELRAEKVRQVKEIVAKGEYEVDSREVAKSIIRTEVSRRLEKSKVQTMNIDPTKLFALIEEEIALGEKIAAQRGRAKADRRNVERRRALPTNRCRAKSSFLDFVQ
jgi:flagellar biosynthesis anti-sigma factor FlgM